MRRIPPALSAQRQERAKIARSRQQAAAYQATLEGQAHLRICREFSQKWRAEAEAIEAGEKRHADQG